MYPSMKEALSCAHVFVLFDSTINPNRKSREEKAKDANSFRSLILV